MTMGGGNTRGGAPMVTSGLCNTQWCLCHEARVDHSDDGQPHNSGKIVYQDHDNGPHQDPGQAFTINCILLGELIVQSAAGAVIVQSSAGLDFLEVGKL